MKFLIWSNQHQGWWKANRHGYTTRTDRAGYFSFDEARAICLHANRFTPQASGPQEVMVNAPSPDQIKLDLEHPDR